MLIEEEEGGERRGKKSRRQASSSSLWDRKRSSELKLKTCVGSSQRREGRKNGGSFEKDLGSLFSVRPDLHLVREPSRFDDDSSRSTLGE